MTVDPKAATDSALVAAAVTSPAWAPWLADINAVLTSLTLIVGFILGIARLADFLKKKDKSGKQ